LDIEEFEPARRKPSRLPKLIITLLISLVIIWILLGQLVQFYLNILEFGELYLKPIYFEIIGGFVLAFIALFRFDFKNRRSIFWWLTRLAIRLIRERGIVEELPPELFDFNSFKLPLGKFLLWQVTKVILAIGFFANVSFGMVLVALASGWQADFSSLINLISLPFITPPFDMAYAQGKVIPMLPVLTLIVAPILSAIGIRLIVLVGVTQIIRIILPTSDELRHGIRRIGWRLAVIEGLVALAFFWIAVNLFFPDSIDFNTRYVIGAVVAEGILFTVFALRDKARRYFAWSRKAVLSRFLAVILIAMIAGSIVAVNNSIADAKKVEWRGPYITQQISVNRYFAEIDSIEEKDYEFGIRPVSPDDISTYVERNKELLNKIRLWDWQAAFAKLKPEIGLIPYIDFQDSDILRFNKTLYWSASMKLVLPPTVMAEDVWYAEHLHYTHVPSGFLLLNAYEGRIEDSGKFFKQRRIYYGEGGLFSETWAAYPADRETSDELEGHFYSGEGGITVSPPLSWLFEVNFLLAYPNRAVHLIRYRDVYDRMSLLFPYFQYNWYGKKVDMLPVTDGKETYWLMPLIVSLDTSHVPWSEGNLMLRLVGYALINIYTGKIKIIVIGNDFYSELFKRVYADYIDTEIPDWLSKQIRYPEELFEWRVSMYNYYHVKDPATFIVGKEFFEVPSGLDTYFIYAKPPGFNNLTYVGILSLELRGGGGRNLAGYMIVLNDYVKNEPYGKMIFYRVPLESVTKLLGPTAVLEALEKNPTFAEMRTLLRSPRVGDIILYRVGEHDVYFIPVYTAGAGGVVTELGAVAAVGAAFTGNYYVGLATGSVTAEKAFEEFLKQLAGVEYIEKAPKLVKEDRVKMIKDLFTELGFKIVEPEEISPNISFLEGNLTFKTIEQWNKTKSMIKSFANNWLGKVDKVLMWKEGTRLNFGIMANVKGVVELHYISIELE
jgi:hypothetical protein